jgi:pimeloyl-ACP methyl ester carboxylesterase
MSTAPRVRPYEVHVDDATLDDLRERLARTRWPDQVTGAGWDYGSDVGYLRELCAYWADGFDWRAQERAINELAHFRAEIDGVGLHFVHERGTGPDPTPLLLLHGWPSSFLQMLKIIPLLCDPASFGGDPADAFDVVVPSLPGYGFSDRPTEPGMNVARVAERLCALMDELGYARYAIRASDLGAGVAPQMAMQRPDAVLALHMSGSNPWVDLDDLPADLTAAEHQMVADARAFRQTEFAYAQQHATKPQSLAVGLNDSPAGLAAWIVEKLRAWSDCDGDLERRFTRDEVLSQLTVYWATQTIGSSIRLYYESRRHPPAGGAIAAPVAMAMLPADMYRTPREWLERQGGPLARFTELPRGGHFGEHEEPELLADDLRAFLRELR